MGRGQQSAGGVEVRETSIRILFSHQGKQRKETLYLDNAPLPPTPANVKYARRVAAEIRAKIKNGEFDYAEYFPHSPRATEKPAGVAMFFDVIDNWLKLAELKESTRKQYKTRINSLWKPALPDRPIAEIKYSDILAVLQGGTWKSGKSRNNELSMIKQAFEFARKDKLITENPCDEIARASYQAPAPEPFGLDEVELILGYIKDNYPEQTLNFTQFMFFTGMRTSEGIGLRWTDIDFIRKEAKVDGGIVHDEETESTKTSVARKVKLNSRALEALTRQKRHTFLAGEFVFQDPKTGKPWAYSKITDVRSYWATTLKRTGLQYRRPYNMRHTYATVGLMAGANPGFLAKQLGHSLEVFFRVYADWINGSDNDREMAKIEASLNQISPELTRNVAK